MKHGILMPLLWVIIASLPLPAQEKLYPVRQGNDVQVLLTADRTAFAVEKAFQHKLTVGFPNDDKLSFVPKTRAPLVMLWLRIQNVSQRPLDVDIAKFTSRDDQGRIYGALALDEASRRIVEGAGGQSIGAKTLKGITLGRAANSPSEDELKEDILRYSLRSGQIPPGVVREGLIYFESTPRKKFTVTVLLGDLWSLPLVFSTEKQK